MLSLERESTATGTTRTPVASSFGSTDERFSARVAAIATSKPARANSSAIAAPIPRDAPVTNAALLPIVFYNMMTLNNFFPTPPLRVSAREREPARVHLEAHHCLRQRNGTAVPLEDGRLPS